MLFGPDGNLLRESTPTTEPGLRGGWRYSSGELGGAAASTNVYGIDRKTAQTQCRTLFYTNTLFGSAIEIATAFLIGDEFTYGEMDDKSAQLALDEFWQINDLGSLISDRWMVEYFLDGENATVFPLQELGRDMPARIAYPDVHQGVDLTYSVQDGVTALTTRDANGQDVRYDADHMVWSAHNALYNDPHGWPVALRAADAAQAYTQLLNHRINTHELQQRIMAVYSAFVNVNGKNAAGVPDGGLYEWQQKAAAYSQLPKKGGVLTLAKDPTSGQSETLDFMTPGQGAANAEADARALLRLTGLAIGGLPEHWLGEGGNANRATAGEMSAPAVRIAGKRQGAVRSYLNAVMRRELKRRYGPDKLYKVKSAKVGADGLTRVVSTRKVRADLLEMPWQLPTLTQNSLADLVKLAQVAGQMRLGSPQSISARLGFDPSVEAELLAAIGQTFGQADPAVTPAPMGGNSDPIEQP